MNNSSQKLAEAQQWSAEDFFPRIKRDKDSIGYSKYPYTMEGQNLFNHIVDTECVTDL